MRIFHCILFVLLLSSVSLPVYGENEWEVSSPMELMPTNSFAAVHQRQDTAGQVCGVLIVHSLNNDLKFTSKNVESVIRKGSDYYVYISPESTSLTISYSDKEVELNLLPIKSKHTYELTFSQKPDYGTLRLETVPTGCNVVASTKDGEIDLGRSPVKGTIELRPGKYQITISKKNFKSKTKTITIIKTQETDLGVIELKPL